MPNKSTLIFLLALLWGGQSFSQTYVPFPMNSAAWGQQRTLWNPTGNQVDPYYYFLDGDTTLNGQVYTKLFYKYGNIFPAIDTANAVFGGAIREDSSRKVYFLSIGTPCPYPYLVPQNPIQEYLLYDFGAAVGDTFYTENGVGPLINVVVGTGVDTLFGVPRRWKFVYKGYSSTELNYGDRQYEGIGSRYDLLYPFCTPFEEDHQLMCFEDSTVSWGGCFPANRDKALEMDIEVQVAPHPVNATSRLTIETTGLGQFDLEVVDLQGRLLVRKSLRGGEKFPIGKAGLESGTYLYRVTQTGKTLSSGKLLVR